MSSSLQRGWGVHVYDGCGVGGWWLAPARRRRWHLVYVSFLYSRSCFILKELLLDVIIGFITYLAARFNQRQYRIIQASKSVVTILQVCNMVPNSRESFTLLTCLNSDRSSHTSSRRINWNSLHGRISPSHGTMEKKRWRSRSHERGENGRGIVWCKMLFTLCTYSWDQPSSERWNALRPLAVSNL